MNISFRRQLDSRRGTPPCRRGFTLIEILVVVAIISLLIAVLMPSLSRARFQARLVACGANLHDLGGGMHMYADSYRGYFPVTSGSGEDNFFGLWKARLLKNPNVLIDPSTSNVMRTVTLTWPLNYRNGPEGNKIPYLKDPAGAKRSNGDEIVADICDNAYLGRDDSTGGHSYEYNGVYGGNAKDSPAYGGKHKKQSHFRLFLSQVALITDNDDRRQDMPAAAAAQGCTVSMAGNGNNCPQPWDNHGENGMNILFADGHTQWVRKMAGTYPDANGAPLQSSSALIDRVMSRSQEPWKYFKH